MDFSLCAISRSFQNPGAVTGETGQPCGCFGVCYRMCHLEAGHARSAGLFQTVADASVPGFCVRGVRVAAHACCLGLAAAIAFSTQEPWCRVARFRGAPSSAWTRALDSSAGTGTAAVLSVNLLLGSSGVSTGTQNLEQTTLVCSNSPS